jgi:type II secretory pathway predicted ATPase ExeA
MRREIMEHYNIIQDFRNAEFHESEEHRQILREIEASLHHGSFMVLSGIVGCGKTTTLNRLQQKLTEKGDVLVAKSMSVDKERVSLSTLLLAMFYDLATEKDFVIPTQSERRERALRELIRKRKKPVVLFIDEAHDLQSKTLVGLKRLMEMVRYGGGILSVVLAGHPKLKNDLRRPTMEEIGNRATVFSLDNAHGANREYIYWLLKQCVKPDTASNTLFQDEAIDLLAEKLATPLQIGQHVTLALEEAFHIGGQPVTVDVVDSVLAKDINEIEPILTRHGYGTKALTELLDINGAEVRKLLRGQLPPGRTNELQSQMLKVGLPL